MKKDQKVCCFWLVVGICFCIGALSYSFGNINNPGPGFFPFFAGAGLSILSTLYLIQLAKHGKEVPALTVWPDRYRALKAARVVIALVIYSICIQFVGFSTSTFFLLIYLTGRTDPHKWYVVLYVAILGTLCSTVIFKYWLGVPFPEGILGLI